MDSDEFLDVFPLLNPAFSQEKKDDGGIPDGRLLTPGTILVIVLGFCLRLYAATSLHGSVYKVFYAGLHFEDAEMKLDAFRPILYPFLQYASWIVLERIHGFDAIPQALTKGR